MQLASGTELGFVDSYRYNIAAFRLAELLGLDDIGLSLKHGGALEKFEQHHDQEFWLAPRPANAATTQGAI